MRTAINDMPSSIESAHQHDSVSVVRPGLALAAALLGFFVVAQARGAHPMMPLDLFRSWNVSVAVGFAFMVGYYGLPFVMSLYLRSCAAYRRSAQAWRSCR